MRLPDPHICCPAHNGAVFPPREGPCSCSQHREQAAGGGGWGASCADPAVDPSHHLSLGPRGPPSMCQAPFRGWGDSSDQSHKSTSLTGLTFGVGWIRTGKPRGQGVPCRRVHGEVFIRGDCTRVAAGRGPGSRDPEAVVGKGPVPSSERVLRLPLDQ